MSRAPPEDRAAPAGPIDTVADVFADRQVIARGLKLTLVDEVGTKIPSVASPIVIDGVRMAAERPSPRLGADGGMLGER